MLKKIKFNQLSNIFPIAVIILIFFSISPPKKLVVFNQSENNSIVGEIYGSQKIGQTFVAEHNNLSAIKVLLATYDRDNSGDFIFHLKSDIGSKEDLVNYRVDIPRVYDNNYYNFQFLKIRNSKGKKFYFYIEAPQSRPGNAITIWYNSADLYKDGEKIINGEVSKGDLAFKTEYDEAIKLKFDTLLNNIIKFNIFIVNIFKNKIIYFLLIIIIFIGAIIAFSKKLDLFNKKGGFLLVCLILLVIMLAWIFVAFSKRITIFNQQEQDIPVGEIFGGMKIGQTFVAEYNNLSAIEIRLATYNRKNSGEFIFHLKNDVSSEEDLYYYKGDIKKVKDNKYYNFKFPKISSSKGETFYFYLEAPQSQPGNAMTIWSNSKDLYEEGEKFVNGAAASGDLVFKTNYDSGLKNNFNIFLENITQNRPSPFNKKSFYITLISLFVLSGSLFMTFLIKFFIES